MRYAIVLEKNASGYKATLSDSPESIVTGVTREEIESCIKQAIERHIKGVEIHKPSNPSP
jgi:predicted RNase H-like HicB family nuclease